jgi:hypothetical protein
MPNPVAYNATTPPSGGFQRATITYGLSGSNYGANSPGGLTYYNSLPTSSAWVIVSDSYTLGLSTQGNAKPVMWSTGSASTGSLIRLINGLPSMTSSFTDYYSAVNWLQSTNKYFLLNNGYENIVTDGLVLNLDAGWWNSYPTTGTTWTDLSGNNYTGTLTNGPTFNSANSGSIVFDGTNDYCQLSQNIFNTSYPGVTFGAWVYLNGSTGEALIAGVWNQTANGDQAALFIFSNGPFIAVSDGVNGENGAGASNTLNVNQWYYIAASWNSNRTYKYYQNGSLLGTGTQGGNGWNSSSTANFEIGGENNASIRYFNGRIACSQVYNRTLSDSEVLQNYNAQKSRFGL